MELFTDFVRNHRTLAEWYVATVTPERLYLFYIFAQTAVLLYVWPGVRRDVLATGVEDIIGYQIIAAVLAWLLMAVVGALIFWICGVVFEWMFPMPVRVSGRIL